VGENGRGEGQNGAIGRKWSQQAESKAYDARKEKGVEGSKATIKEKIVNTSRESSQGRAGSPAVGWPPER